MSNFEGSEKKSRSIPALSESLSVFRDRKTDRWPDRAPIEELKGDRDWIVRGFTEKNFPDIGQEKPTGTFAERALAVPKLFKELEEKYGIVAPVHFFMGENEAEEPTFFVMTEKVAEVNFHKLGPHEKEQFRLEDEKMLRAVLTYYKDKVASGEELLPDIAKLDQYLYGTLKGESKPHLYFVDTDPFVLSRTSPMRYPYINGHIGQLISSLENIEKQHGIDLTDLHDEAADFYNQLTKPIQKPT